MSVGRIRWVTGLFLLIVLLEGCGRDKGKIIAVVNGEEISAEDFRLRYKAYCENTGIRDNIKARRQVLENMISEQLIGQDIRRTGLDSREDYRRRIEEIELQALLDGYARRVSSDTLTVSETETLEEFRRYRTKVTARYLYARTLEGARELKRRLGQGETFETLAREVFDDPGLASNGGNLGTFGWGDMEAAIEEEAYTLPIGAVSDPVRISIGYAVVKVEHRMMQPLASEADYAKAKEVLSRAITDRKNKRLIEAAGHDAARSLAPEFNERVVSELHAAWPAIAARPTVEESAAPIRSLPDSLRAAPLVRFRSGAWTVDQFLTRLDRTTDRQKNRVKSIEDVKAAAIGLATREELLRRAREAGLEADSSVRRQRDRLEHEFRLRYWASTVQDSVGRSGWDERILRREYSARKSELALPPEVNVAEILVRTRGEAEAVLAQLRRGASFGDLARRHSVRLKAAEKGGELGYGTRATFGPLADAFFSARVGDIIGPESVDPYVGVFKILGRHEGRSLTYEEARPRLEAMLTEAKRREAVQTAVGSLRSKASVSVETSVLEHVTL